MQRSYHVRSILLVLALAAALTAACGDARVDEVERGVRHAARLLERSKKDLPTALSYNSIAETGGTPVTFLTANTLDPESAPPYIWEGPPAPFSIVVRNGSEPGEIVLEGYADKTDKPAVSASVKNCGSGEKRNE